MIVDTCEYYFHLSIYYYYGKKIMIIKINFYKRMNK